MKNESIIIEYIDRYRCGELSETEKKLFESCLHYTPLKREMDLHRRIDEAMTEADVDELRKKLAAIMQHQRQPRAYLKTLWSTPLVRVAAILVLFLLPAWFFLQQPSPDLSGEDLFQKYYQPQTFHLRSGSLELPITGDNPETIVDSLHAGIAQDSTRYALYFLRALQYVELSQDANAIHDLQHVIRNEGHLYGERARWLLGLLWLKTGEVERAVHVLNSLASGQGYYAERAREVLSHLD